MNRPPVTQPERAMLDFLQKCRDMTGAPIKDGYHYRNFYDFVIQNGVWYTPQPLPPGYKRGEPRACFINATDLVYDDPELVYVEGYASGGKVPPIGLHAWAGKGDLAIDPTWLWDEDDDYHDPRDGAMLGVPFTAEMRAITVLKCKYASIIDDWPNGWPLMREPYNPDRAFLRYLELPLADETKKALRR